MKNIILPRLVITGSEGLIGKHLVNHFKKNFEILRLDLALGHDLTNDSFVTEWFKKNRNLYGIIVCHAYNPTPYEGSGKIEPVDVPLSEIRQYLEINTVSAFNVCRHFIKNNKRGAIINLSSIYGELSPHHDIYNNYVKPIGYSLSKGAVNIMSKYLATYYAPNYRINTVVLSGIYDPKMKDDFVSNYSKHVPMKRMMNLDEVIPVFEFLLNKKPSYATGASFYIDGGWTAW
ncbi:MAG: Short-chain dehydrogenase/reductase SDR [uncultured bacterium]|nr:MAG: Short-chain dehydrogenase/reductase SDR [uncultured bacterium]